MRLFRFDLLWRALHEVEATFENGQDERHEEPPERLEVDGQGRLRGPGVRHDTSPKSSRAPILESTGPVLVVDHATATTRLDSRGRPVSIALLDAIRKADGREASWHLLVDPDGVIWQSIPFCCAAWHAGSASAAKVVIGNRRVSVNSCSIGVEYVNAGEARLVDHVWSLKRLQYEAAEPAWRAWPFQGQKPREGAPQGRGPGAIVPEAELVTVGGRKWHAYTPAQFEARRLLMDALTARWPALLREVTLEHPDGRRRAVSGSRCGHLDIDPVRKADPYPTFLP